MDGELGRAVRNGEKSLTSPKSIGFERQQEEAVGQDGLISSQRGEKPLRRENGC
jgi:hypothetical protein